VNRLLRNINATGYAERKYGSGRKCTARTSEIDAVEELILSQEDTPKSEIYRILRHFENTHMTLM